jgi:glycosyltransferase involved in cell wall biosynthesis
VPAELGFVVIGRNEGERLRRCLLVLVEQPSPVVYVDSGSDDGSPRLARALGIEVVELDRQRPFTAARARNAGFRRLLAMSPDCAYVQFLDGDTEMRAEWADTARGFLTATPQVAVVSGRLHERNRDRSIYNLLCDIEWDRPPGEALECGGNAMIRASAFRSVGGFREDLIAGEEPDLCVRLRSAGWRIWRLPDDMALHDANMTRFSQWWRRAYRSGHGFAEGRHWVRESRRAWAWGLGLPLLGAAGVAAFGTAGWLVFLLYPLQLVRLAMRGDRPTRENWWHALFLVLGKFPEALGQLRFMIGRCFGMRSGLIEYK